LGERTRPEVITADVLFFFDGHPGALALYEALLAPLCEGEMPEPLERRLTGMACLTPGDFHAVRAQYDPLFTAPGEVTHELLVEALAREAELKIEPKECRIGFLG